tara:strand:- start:10 stop:378 length:369 start_codon:yes stop_codon:yes gene_type:complete
MTEIENIKIEKVEKELSGKNKRAGMTTITSVSLSKEFSDIIKNNGISPTEALRKGVAVELAELGVARYMTAFNLERIEEIRDLLDSFEELEDLKKRKKKVIKTLEGYKDNVEKMIKYIRKED